MFYNSREKRGLATTVANRRSFKSDVSFLEKISMGAIGTRRVFQDLRDRAHNPLELERGSMSFKIWKDIKIKRIRVPDILCVACGVRVESRAKTAFEISMSHSLSDPERGWDYGLKDEDSVAIVICRRVGDRPIDWEADQLVQYVPVRELRSAQQGGRATLTKPKGAEEGFEARITWPAVAASASGVVTSAGAARVQYRRDMDGRVISVALSRQRIALSPLVSQGDKLAKNQVIASVVPVVSGFSCPESVSRQTYVTLLTSPSLSDRYTAAKALSVFQAPDIADVLATKLGDVSDHIYVRLEAAASLARNGDQRGIAFIQGCLRDDYLQNRLEAVIVLGEAGGPQSSRLLTEVLLNDKERPEIRAGAAWALGELHDRSALQAFMDSFEAIHQSVRIEAARALAKLAASFTQDVLREFRLAPPSRRAGIAWALSKAGRFKVGDLLEALADLDARQWVAYMLGTQDEARYIYEIEQLRAKDPEVYFAVTVLWKIMSSWVYGLEEYL